MQCPVFYTGYVVQEEAREQGRSGAGETIQNTLREGQSPTKFKIQNFSSGDASRRRSQPDGLTKFPHLPTSPSPHLPLSPSPLILTSVGGGRFGHNLLHCVAEASVYLENRIPHHIQMFTGPFSPASVYEPLQELAATRPNLTVEQYTPNLLAYMGRADLSINMGGYNTTLNVLKTGVRSLLLPFTGNGDQEQTIRAERLEALGVVSMIRPDDLQPQPMAERIIAYLQTQPTALRFDLNGVAQTANILQALAHQERAA
ncbi:MAG: hypothetical protein HC812_06340 [Leptolyngbya sp. RL_3_1]|nr:hypothetical protein [Leptolyngbya sp. RL_3_1]